MSLITRRNVKPRLAMRLDLLYILLMLMTRGLHSLRSRGCIRLLHAPHINQPALQAGLGCIRSTLIFGIELLAVV